MQKQPYKPKHIATGRGRKALPITEKLSVRIETKLLKSDAEMFKKIGVKQGLTHAELLRKLILDYLGKYTHTVNGQMEIDN